MKPSKAATITITVHRDDLDRLVSALRWFKDRPRYTAITPQNLKAAYIAFDNLLETLPLAMIDLNI